VTDDGDADDGMKSLRAVWLSMPDEEPPERGFAELMAAARVKADEMARPSLWERIVATLRRPPVLALATVTVLVGGAVMIGRNKDDLEVRPETKEPATMETNVETIAPSAAPPIEEAAQGSAAAAPSTTGAAEPAEGGAAGAPVVGSALRDDKSKGPAPKTSISQRSRPTSSTTPATKATTTTRADLDSSDDTGERVKDSTKKPETTKQSAPGGGGTGATAHSGAEIAADSALLPDDQPTRLPPPPTPAELHARARHAMTRGDCEGARRLTRQIASLDATYFKTKVVGDSALKGCIAN
jgi:hypothetical protein